jgi:C_GCAxxG_C_C family probable redox protein
VCQELEIENEIIPRIASGFAGGMGNTGAVCGAVVGAVMAIGLKQGRGAPTEDRDATSGGEQDFRRSLEQARAAPTEDLEAMLAGLKVVQEFRRRFEAEMDTITCRDLTGADLSTEEGLQQFMSSDTPLTVCLPAVGVAYRLVVDLLKESS